jgi:hypothetical protein
MSSFDSVVILALGDPLAHDPEGKLLQLGKKATGVALAAHLLPDESEDKEKLFQKAIDIRHEERAGWLAVRTEAFPNGDLEGAAKASLAIAVYYVQQCKFDEGMEWLNIAYEQAPESRSQVRAYIKYNMDVVSAVLDSCSQTTTNQGSGRASPDLDDIPWGVPVGNVVDQDLINSEGDPNGLGDSFEWNPEKASEKDNDDTSSPPPSPVLKNGLGGNGLEEAVAKVEDYLDFNGFVDYEDGEVESMLKNLTKSLALEVSACGNDRDD